MVNYKTIKTDDLIIYSNPNFGELYAFKDENDKLWFIANDVFKAMDYEVSAITQKLKCFNESEVGTIRLSFCKSFNHKRRTMSYNAVEEFAHKSRKPKANEFLAWVKSEVANNDVNNQKESTTTNTTMNVDNDNNLTTFTNDMFGNIRTYVDEDNKIWFIAKDICDILEQVIVDKL